MASAVGDRALYDCEWRKQRELVGGGSADEERDHARHTAMVGRSRRSMALDDKAECGRDDFEEMPGNSGRLKVG